MSFPALGDMPRRLRETLAASDAIVAVEDVEPAQWDVELADGVRVLVEWCTGPDMLILSSALGQVVAARRAAVYATLLSLNLMWRETQGLRAGLTGAEGEVLLVQEFIWRGGEVELAPLLIAFANDVAVWSDYVTHDDAQDDPPAFDAPTHFERA